MPKGMKRFLISFLMVMISSLIAWNANGRSFIGVDDAEIYHVYMKHVSEGHGFVYNIGGERVEGFTSLLWTIIGAGIHYMSLPLELTLMLLNVMLIALLLSRIWGYIDGDSQLWSLPSFAFFSLLFVMPGFFEWTILSQLETGLWTMLLGLIILGILKQEVIWKMCVFFILFVLCRPEAMLWGIALATVYVIGSMNNRVFEVKRLFPLFAVLLITGLLISWRLSYFGFPLPNTYYAKVSSDIFSNAFVGMKYIAKFFVQMPIIPIIMGPVILELFKQFRESTLMKLSIYDWTIVTVFVTSFFIPFYTGGDHFELSRFFQPVLPFFILSFCKTTFFERFAKHSRILLLVFISMVSSRWIVYAFTESPLKHEWNIAIEGRKQSRALNGFFEGHSLPIQGVLTAGSTAYAYEGKTIDLLGLNNVEMAHAESVKKQGIMKNHASFVPEVFYRQEPDVFWMAGGFSNKEPNVLDIPLFNANIFRNIQRDPQFKKMYGAFALRNKNGIWLMTFMNREYVQSLDTNLFYIKEIPTRELRN